MSLTKCEPPDVCKDDTNGVNHSIPPEHHNDGSLCGRIHYFFERDRPIVIAIVVLVLLLNVQEGRYILYPFTIFSTWVHEMCHGMAAVLVGGRIGALYIYGDGSGLAYTWTSGEDWKRGVVASAGYVGTALMGGVLLLFRRTRRGPTIGLIGIGIGMLVSCCLVVRNTFGIVAITLMGVFLCLAGWKFKVRWVGYLYSFLAVTCSFNAFTSIQELFQPGVGYVNGKERYSDAHTVAEYFGMTYVFWAICWLVFAILSSAIGLLFPVEFKPRSPDLEQATPRAYYPMPSAPTLSQTEDNYQYPLAASAPPAYHPRAEPFADNAKVQRLVAMGFSTDRVVYALRKHNNSEELALDELLVAV